ncbi:Glycosyltransferase [Azospirillum doebereinerae]
MPPPILPRSRRTEGPPAASAQTIGLRKSWAGEGPAAERRQSSCPLPCVGATACTHLVLAVRCAA